MSESAPMARAEGETPPMRATPTDDADDASFDGRPKDEPPPPPRVQRKLHWVHLVGVTFFAVCGGDYGLEESIGAGGAALTIIGLIVIPWIWSLPIALMTAELGSMIPEAGGYVVWVDRAFGTYAARCNATWNLISNTFDNALYPVMFVDYLQYFALFRVTGASRWLMSTAMLMGVTCLNLTGVDIVAQVSNGFAVFVILPFVALTIAGAHTLRPAAWVHSIKHIDDQAPVELGPYLAVLLWNTSGYDSVGALAAEVRDPGRDFPRAMFATIVLVGLVYVVPLGVAVSMEREAADLRTWTDGHFVIVASEQVGDWLAAWITLGGAVSCIGLLNTLMCTSARVAVSAARLGVLPQRLAEVHSASGTPRAATIAIAVALAAAVLLPFARLVGISMLFYAVTTALEFSALIRLRYTEASTPRPFVYPARGVALFVSSTAPLALCLLLIVTAPADAWALLLLATAIATFAHVRVEGAMPRWWRSGVALARGYTVPARGDSEAKLKLPDGSIELAESEGIRSPERCSQEWHLQAVHG